ncbi:MAG: M23 family metallopeptidase [SAR324 cluster bacterium]|uniref:M23 family metallopeptidase n=1 Tax=SAR324 cluster bacterium TaxID=2024889 RepID=A0A7X9FS73_9DELT|nr:M23 family metallopeptidase [SAR324 cluster bacterium]
MSYRSLLVIIIFAALIPLFAAEYGRLSAYFLDLKGPTILPHEGYPRGIGLAPVTIKLDISDSAAGLHEISVWTRQGHETKDFLQKKFPISHLIEKLSLDFNGPTSKLKEGEVEVIVRAIDASWWRNAAELIIPLVVDFSKPKIEIITKVPSPIKENEAELVFYRASDNKLALSGIKIENTFSPGVPARHIDSDLNDDSFFVCLFSVPAGSRQHSTRLIGEDLVGNSMSEALNFNIERKISNRTERKISKELLAEHFKKVIDVNSLRIDKVKQRLKAKTESFSSDVETNLNLEKFKILNEALRVAMNEEFLAQINNGARIDRCWNDVFLKPSHEIKSGFGDEVTYTFEGKAVSGYRQFGYEFAASLESRSVLAANDGFIILNGDFGPYGKVLAIDHGLGIVSMYGNLESTNALRGEKVHKGQEIALAGSSGLLPPNSYYFEMRLNGDPIDAEEWWNPSKYDSKIKRPIDDLKRSLGIQILKPLERKF